MPTTPRPSLAFGAFTWAIHHRDGDLVTHLLAWSEAKSALTEQSENRTLLHLAAIEGDRAVIRALVSGGAAVDARNSVGDTPLHAAARAGATTAVDTLLSLGANRNVANHQGERPWDVAQHAATKAALAPTHQADEWGATLIEAALAGREAVVRQILSRADAHNLVDMVDPDGTTALMAAASRGHVPVLRQLIASGAALNTQTPETMITALHAAVANNHPFATRELLARGANQHLHDADGHTPLISAVVAGNDVIVRALLEMSTDAIDQPDSTDRGYRPLHHALERNPIGPIVDLLLQFGADTQATSEEGVTPEQIAKENGARLIKRLGREQGLEM